MTPDPGNRLIFLHLPKTAGVNVRELLSRQYRHLPTFIRGAPDHRLLFQMHARDREAFRVVGGHYRFGLHLLFDSPSRYMTFLRDPIERVISHYAYIRWQALHEWHERVNAANLSLEQWVRFGIAHAFDNLQVRWLAPHANQDVPFRHTTRQMLDEAKRVIEERVDFLGITERYEESIRLFGRQLDWREPVTVERLNVSPNRQAAADIPPSTMAAILDHNVLDIELYAFALRLFERRLSSGEPVRSADRMRAVDRAPSETA
jgi:hypothetical protein